MSVRINTNIEALNAQRNLGITSLQFSKSVEKLSSGLRINRAADDAAGLAISQKLQAQVNGLNQAQRNAQDAISMVQTAEGALNEVQSMLQRMRELAVQAANSTLSTSDATSVNTEVTALKAEIDRIAGATTFNGQSLLTGALSVAQSGGTAAAGAVVVAGTNTSLSAVDVTGAKASTTYTLTSQAGGKLTLSDGTNSQQVTLAATAANGSQKISFGNLGVSITVSSVTGESAANVVGGLASLGGGGGGPSTIGGNAGANLVTGEALSANATVTAGGSVTYSTPNGLDSSGGATPLTATAGAGVGAGTLTIGPPDIVLATGAISVSYDGETFTGNLAAPSPGALSTTVLTGGTTGHTITLNYKQNTAPLYANATLTLAWDVLGASFNFVASGTAATVANIAGPTATAGTYTFTSSSGSTLTLTGPGGTQTINVADTAAGTTQTLTFGTLGISFDLVANGLGNFSKASAIGNLVQAGNNTIVVNAGGGGGAGGTVITGAGSSATFQVGANSGDSLGVSFADARTSAVGYGTLVADISTFSTATGSGNGIITAASTLISSVDVALNYVSTTRGNFGAVQNRLEHTIASLGVSSENLSASASRIKDLDVAAEMVTFTKTQILQQAGTAILAQANQAPQGVLSLLR